MTVKSSGNGGHRGIISEQLSAPKDVRTFTAYLPESDIADDDTVIARGLSSVEAMKTVFGHLNGWKTHVDETDYVFFVDYVLIALPDKRPPERSFTERLYATVIKTADPERDKAVALDILATKAIRFNHLYWDGRVESDASFDERLRRVAAARETRRIDRKIATGLVDAFLADGYTITCDLQDVESEFACSTDRDGILEYLWQIEIAELAVHKNGELGRVRLVFDEEGWDLVQDHTVGLESIIDPVCEPHLPWNRPDAEGRDHGIRVLALDSPDDVLKIGRLLK